MVWRPASVVVCIFIVKICFFFEQKHCQSLMRFGLQPRFGLQTIISLTINQTIILLDQGN